MELAGHTFVPPSGGADCHILLVCVCVFISTTTSAQWLCLTLVGIRSVSIAPMFTCLRRFLSSWPHFSLGWLIIPGRSVDCKHRTLCPMLIPFIAVWLRNALMILPCK